MRHGLTAETVIDTLADAADYRAFETAVVADYDAETAVERELVLRLASVLWRQRRATCIESACSPPSPTKPTSLSTQGLPSFLSPCPSAPTNGA